MPSRKLWALLCLALATCASCGRDEGWHLVTVASLTSPALEAQYAREARSVVAKNLWPYTLLDYLEDASFVQLTIGTQGRLFVVHCPADDGLDLTVLDRSHGTVRTGASWRLEEDVVFADGPRSLRLACKLAMTARVQDGALALWYVHPWSGKLVRWHFQLAPGRPSKSVYDVPWHEPLGSRVLFDSLDTSVRFGPHQQHLWLAHLTKNGPTYLHLLDTGSGQWQSRKVSEAGLPDMQLVPGPSGEARVFFYADFAIRELANGNGEPRSRTLSAGPFVVLADASGNAHLFYGSFTPGAGELLLHRYESAEAWVEEQVDCLGVLGLERTREEPIRPDLRLSACLDDSGAFHVAYFDFVGDVLKYATNRTSQWECETVAASEAIASTSIVAEDGFVAIAYADLAEQRVYLAVR